MYVTVGTGGAALHKFNGKAPYVATQYMGFGFLDISITSNGRNMTGSFYSSSDNLVKDSFTLLKSGWYILKYAQLWLRFFYASRFVKFTITEVDILDREVKETHIFVWPLRKN